MPFDTEGDEPEAAPQQATPAYLRLSGKEAILTDREDFLVHMIRVLGYKKAIEWVTNSVAKTGGKVIDAEDAKNVADAEELKARANPLRGGKCS
jgi:hypothetical protein